MMAGWDLVELETELPRLDVPVTLVHAEGDRFVAPDQAMRVGRRLPKSESIELPSLGHLAHEERPDRIEALLRDLFAVPAGAAAAP